MSVTGKNRDPFSGFGSVDDDVVFANIILEIDGECFEELRGARRYGILIIQQVAL